MTPNYDKLALGHTLAEVIDWLARQGIVVEFLPFRAYALKEGVVFTYKVYNFKEDNSLIFQKVEELSSFKLAMKEIITKLIEMKLI